MNIARLAVLLAAALMTVLMVASVRAGFSGSPQGPTVAAQTRPA